MCPGQVSADDAFMRRALIIAAFTPLVVLASCGDDDDGAANSAAAARTDAEYCADLEALPDDGGPTDAFFEAHPNPTLADWADGLPDVIARSTKGRDQFAEIEPSVGLADERQTLLDAFDAIIASFETSLDAARAGDQEAFDAEEARNQDENVPALTEAFEGLQTGCEADG